MIQALKFECYHTSALARMLLEKSVVSVRIAHHLYWLVLVIYTAVYQCHVSPFFLHYYIMGLTDNVQSLCFVGPSQHQNRVTLPCLTLPAGSMPAGRQTPSAEATLD